MLARLKIPPVNLAMEHGWQTIPVGGMRKDPVPRQPRVLYPLFPPPCRPRPKKRRRGQKRRSRSARANPPCVRPLGIRGWVSPRGARFPVPQRPVVVPSMMLAVHPFHALRLPPRGRSSLRRRGPACPTVCPVCPRTFRPTQHAAPRPPGSDHRRAPGKGTARLLHTTRSVGLRGLRGGQPSRLL
jgi:hypothetical protein